MHNMPINSTRMSHLSQIPGVPYTVNPTLLEGQYAAIHDSRYMRGHRHTPYPTISSNPALRSESKVVGELSKFCIFDTLLCILLVIIDKQANIGMARTVGIYLPVLWL